MFKLIGMGIFATLLAILAIGGLIAFMVFGTIFLGCGPF